MSITASARKGTLPRIWLRIKGWIMAVTAFIACPCHLPITLPLAIGLTAGTAIGAWMASNTLLIYAVATVYFLGGGALAYKWLTKDAR